jgi:hypothetical protein
MLIYIVLAVVVLIVVVLGVFAPAIELSNLDISTEAGSSVQGPML